MNKICLIFLLLVLFNANFYPEQKIIDITFENLLKHEFFNEHEGQGPGEIIFKPVKFRTVFTWPGNIKKMTLKDTKKINELLNNKKFADSFGFYVDIESKVKVTWSENEVTRKTRIYLQNQLMQYIDEELITGDKIETEYWVFGPFSSFDQIIYCFMVAYQEVN